MLVVAESGVVRCGAVVGQDDENTIIVFHPALGHSERERFARELLTEGELVLWQERMRAAG